MARDERDGLIAIFIILILSLVLCYTLTDGGRVVTNLFSNIFSIPEDTHPQSIEAQFELIKQQMSPDWVIGSALVETGFITLVFIFVYLFRQRRVVRSWCLCLVVFGATAASLLVTMPQLERSIAAVKVGEPQMWDGTNTRDGLLAAISAAGQPLGVLGILLMGMG